MSTETMEQRVKIYADFAFFAAITFNKLAGSIALYKEKTEPAPVFQRDFARGNTAQTVFEQLQKRELLIGAVAWIATTRVQTLCTEIEESTVSIEEIETKVIELMRLFITISFGSSTTPDATILEYVSQSVAKIRELKMSRPIQTIAVDELTEAFFAPVITRIVSQ